MSRTEIAALGGLFAANLTLTALAVAIPTMADDLGGSSSALVWALSGPIVLRAAVGPSIGRLGDMIGRRRVLAAGLAFAAVFTLAIAGAPSVEGVVAARLAAAIGAAVIGPMSVAVLNEGASPDQRAKAMGRFALVGAGSPALGLVAGGPIVDVLGWRWLFGLQAMLIASFALVAITTIGADAERRRVPFDVGGAGLLGAGLALILLGVSFLGDAAGVRGAAALAAAGVLLLAFWRRQLDHPAPLIPVRSFARRPFALPAGLLALSAFGYMGGFILTPMLLQDVFGYSATTTSLLSITRPMAFAVSGPLAGRLLGRLGPRRIVAVGTASVSLSLVLLAVAAGTESRLLIVLALALSGLGQGSALTSAAAAVADAVDEDDLGVAAATQQTMEMIGVSVGIQSLAAVAVAGGSDEGAFAVAYLVGGVAAATASLVAVIVPWRGRGHAEGHVARSGADAEVEE